MPRRPRAPGRSDNRPRTAARPLIRRGTASVQRRRVGAFVAGVRPQPGSRTSAPPRPNVRGDKAGAAASTCFHLQHGSTSSASLSLRRPQLQRVLPRTRATGPATSAEPGAQQSHSVSVRAKPAERCVRKQQAHLKHRESVVLGTGLPWRPCRSERAPHARHLCGRIQTQPTCSTPARAAHRVFAAKGRPASRAAACW